MAKRFTDSAKWKRPWFRKLPLKAKLAWIYVCDECDHRGVWPYDVTYLSQQIGAKVSEAEFLEWFGRKVAFIAPDEVFIRSFWEFQYGALKPENNAHKAIIALLDRFPDLKKGAPDEGLMSPSGGALEEEEEEEKDKVKKKEKKSAQVLKVVLPPLAEIWNQFADPCLPRVAEVARTGRRREALDARWSEKPDPAYWTAVIARINSSKGCLGANDRNWKADFDFLCRPDTAAKVLEGKYDLWGIETQPGSSAPVDPKQKAEDAEFERRMAEARAQL